MSDGLRLAPSAWRRTLSVAAGGGLALFIFIAPARAQDDVQGWGAVFGSGPIAKGSRVLDRCRAANLARAEWRTVMAVPDQVAAGAALTSEAASSFCRSFARLVMT